MSSTTETQLDHAVINTQYAMDDAAQCFSQLGFSLTDKGYHSLGSINHLMMFGTDYLELIGLPDKADGEQPRRRGISDAPRGINGLVFKTTDAQKTFAHLQDVGLAGDPPNSFSRPVQTAQGSQDARFQTVHVRPDVCEAGRIYFCQHFTPELVWREQDQQHSNKTQAIAQMVLVSTDLQREIDTFTRLLGVSARITGDQTQQIRLKGFTLQIMSLDAYRLEYGALATEMNGRSAMFGAITFQSATPEPNPAASLQWPSVKTANGWRIRQPDFDCLLEFGSVQA